jgi:hypothetical protein
MLTTTASDGQLLKRPKVQPDTGPPSSVGNGH